MIEVASNGKVLLYSRRRSYRILLSSSADGFWLSLMYEDNE